MLTLEDPHIQDEAAEGMALWVEAYLAWGDSASDFGVDAGPTEAWVISPDDSALFPTLDPMTLSTFGVWDAPLLDAEEHPTVATSLSCQADWDEDDEEAADDDDDDEEDDEDEDFFADDDDDLDDDDEFEDSDEEE